METQNRPPTSYQEQYSSCSHWWIVAWLHITVKNNKEFRPVSFHIAADGVWQVNTSPHSWYPLLSGISGECETAALNSFILVKLVKPFGGNVRCVRFQHQSSCSVASLNRQTMQLIRKYLPKWLLSRSECVALSATRDGLKKKNICMSNLC